MLNSCGLDIIINDNSFLLLAEKAVFWKEAQMLIVADVHLGKATHFRKNGISLPALSGTKDLVVLRQLIKNYGPKKIVFLGDLFHSNYNSEWQTFIEFRNEFLNVDFILSKGNHDILPMHRYVKNNIMVVNYLQEECFIFLHDRLDYNFDNLPQHFIFSGHIHPGYKLKGRAKQSLTLPCFYKNETELVLPAFGVLTGLFIIKPKKNEQVFVVGNDNVFQIDI
jgi:DNA ligase-associated metallophosphoesterase